MRDRNWPRTNSYSELQFKSKMHVFTIDFHLLRMETLYFSFRFIRIPKTPLNTEWFTQFGTTRWCSCRWTSTIFRSLVILNRVLKFRVDVNRNQSVKKIEITPAYHDTIYNIARAKSVVRSRNYPSLSVTTCSSLYARVVFFFSRIKRSRNATSTKYHITIKYTRSF